MSEDSQIPLLQDLLYKGQPKSDSSLEDRQILDEHSDMEIEQDIEKDDVESEMATDNEQEDESSANNNASAKALISEEEIRSILERHMEQAYEEITRLLHNRNS